MPSMPPLLSATICHRDQDSARVFQRTSCVIIQELLCVCFRASPSPNCAPLRRHENTFGRARHNCLHTRHGKKNARIFEKRSYRCQLIKHRRLCAASASSGRACGNHREKCALDRVCDVIEFVLPPSCLKKKNITPPRKTVTIRTTLRIGSPPRSRGVCIT